MESAVIAPRGARRAARRPAATGRGAPARRLRASSGAMGERRRAARHDGGDARPGGLRAGPRRRGGGADASGQRARRRAEDLVDPGDLARRPGAVLARREQHDGGEALAREAVALVEPTDAARPHHGDALLALAEILALRDEPRRRRPPPRARRSSCTPARERWCWRTGHGPPSGAPNHRSTEVTMPKSEFNDQLDRERTDR